MNFSALPASRSLKGKRLFPSETLRAIQKALALPAMALTGEPADIGPTAVVMASDLCDYITGASIFVDGGMTLYPGFATGG